MAEIIQLGHPPIDITIRHSARARRVSLRVSGLDGKVSLTLPASGSMRAAQAFLREKEPWIRKHLEKQPEVTRLGFGAELPVEGVMRQISRGTVRAVEMTDTQLLISGADISVGPKLRAFLKLMARDRFAAASEHYASAVGKSFGKLTLRDTRSRWGSCSASGNLMYSWRLILAPPEVLDYVVAHEVAHLVEMNHSPRFWAQVEDLMPGYKEPRKWLRQNGSELHRYQF